MDSVILYDPFASTNTGKRAFHHKSRKGCLICKRRKLKCNEGLPCSRCQLGSLRCVFLNDIDTLAQNGGWKRAGPLQLYGSLFSNLDSSLSTLSITSGRKALRTTILKSTEPVLIHSQLAFVAAYLGEVSLCRHHINLAIEIYSRMDSSPHALVASCTMLSSLFYFLGDAWDLNWPALFTGVGQLFDRYEPKFWRDFCIESRAVIGPYAACDKYTALRMAFDTLLLKTELSDADFALIMFLPSKFSEEVWTEFKKGDSEAILMVLLWLILLKRLDRWWCRDQAVIQGKSLLSKLDINSVSQEYASVLLQEFGESDIKFQEIG